MAELLLELYSEEIPAGCQASAAESLRNNLIKNLSEHSITVNNIKYFYSAHRITCVINDLPLLQDKRRIEKKGPAVNAKQQAIDGFLKANNVSLQDLTVQNTPKGDFYFLNQEIEAKSIKDILAHILPTAISNI